MYNYVLKYGSTYTFLIITTQLQFYLKKNILLDFIRLILDSSIRYIVKHLKII